MPASVDTSAARARGYVAKCGPGVTFQLTPLPRCVPYDVGVPPVSVLNAFKETLGGLFRSPAYFLVIKELQEEISNIAAVENAKFVYMNGVQSVVLALLIAASNFLFQ